MGLPIVELFKTFLEQSSVKGSKSTVIQPLCWGLVILIGGIVLLSELEKIPGFILTAMGIAIIIDLLLIFSAFVYFGIKNPDCLRSERFALQKLTIERGGLVGDSEQGFFEPKEKSLTQLKSLPSQEGGQ